MATISSNQVILSTRSSENISVSILNLNACICEVHLYLSIVTKMGVMAICIYISDVELGIILQKRILGIRSKDLGEND